MNEVKTANEVMNKIEKGLLQHIEKYGYKSIFDFTQIALANQMEYDIKTKEVKHEIQSNK